MNPSATIKLFLPLGDPKQVRTAEISNWSGKAVAAPRTELARLLTRSELSKPGVYILLGIDSENGAPLAYIGEAENVGERIKQHRSKDFWNSIVVFVSKDENLTKAHIRYLEGRLIVLSKKVGRFKLDNTTSSGSPLPESDRHDMEVFLERIAQLLPVLGSELLTPIAPFTEDDKPSAVLYCAMKGAEARGMRSANGFVVFKDSTAAAKERDGTKIHGAWVSALREKLKGEYSLVEAGGFLRFSRDVEFASPSAAAAVIYGGTAPGPLAWKDSEGRTLKELEGDG